MYFEIATSNSQNSGLHTGTTESALTSADKVREHNSRSLDIPLDLTTTLTHRNHEIPREPLSVVDNSTEQDGGFDVESERTNRC